MPNNILQQVAREALVALSHLRSSTGPGGVPRLLEWIGWDPSLDAQAQRVVVDALTTSGASVDAAEQFLASDLESLEDVLGCLAAVRQVASSVRSIAEQAPSLSDAALAQALRDLVTDMLGGVGAFHLRVFHPTALAVAELLTVLQTVSEPEITLSGVVVRPARTIHRFRWDRLVELFRDPLPSLVAEYAPPLAAAADVGRRLLPRLAAVLEPLDMLAILDASKAVLTLAATNDASDSPLDLQLSIVDAPGSRLALRVVPAAAIRTTFPIGSGSATVSLSAAEAFTISAAGLAAEAPEITGSVVVSATDPAGSIRFIAGSAAGSRLEISGLEFSATVTLSATAGVKDLSLAFAATDVRMVATPAEGDGFLRSALPADGLAARTPLGLGWSKARGFFLVGGAQLELSLPVNLALGPVTVDSASMSLGSSATPVPGFTASAAVSLGVNIGPIAVSIDRVGVTAGLAFRPGNLGGADLAWNFHPPTGLGLTIDAGPVSGGGFLAFDPEHGRYSGALQLDVFTVAIRALGLLQTPLPGRTDGYSLLVVLTAEFPSIPIGMGFTLNGMGGLAGLHRSINHQALTDGVRNGTARNLLFPRDPVRNAAALLANLEQVFPITEGHYVFGPMVKLGYGSPNFIEAELGIMLQLPEPIMLVLLGKISAFYPNRDHATVILHLDGAGVLDFGAKLFSLDATLYDSRIAAFAVSGDMAMRLTWGDQPSFALAIGGLHPCFAPPPGFPTLRRVTVALGSGDNPRIRLQAYLALTSNSLQFGAAAEVKYTAGSFELSGMLAFDALVIFSPFSFSVHFVASFAVKAGGMSLISASIDATLEGPKPWHLFGRAKLTLLFDVTVPFDLRFGDPGTGEALPSRSAWDALRAEIANPKNWRSELLPGRQQSVALRAPANDDDVAPLDPSGLLVFRQRVVPLGRTLSKFNEASVLGMTRFDLTAITVGTRTFTPTQWTEVTDHFAPGQFEHLTEADKLSRPSFEPMTAGIALGSDEPSLGDRVSVCIEYKTICLGENDTSVTLPQRFTPSVAELRSRLRASAAATGGLGASGNARYAPAVTARSMVTFTEPRYVIASTSTLQDAGVVEPTTQGSAEQALAAYLATRPEKLGALLVVALHEAA